VVDPNGNILQTVNPPTTTSAHSITVDPFNGDVFVALAGSVAAGANTVCPLGCIAVFGPVPVPGPIAGAGLLRSHLGGRGPGRLGAATASEDRLRGGIPTLPPITDELTSVLAFHGQHAFALGTVIALAESRPDLCWRWPSRLVATASETSAAIRTRRLRQPVIAKEPDFTSHALRFPVDGMPRIDRISAPIVLSKPRCSNSITLYYPRAARARRRILD